MTKEIVIPNKYLNETLALKTELEKNYILLSERLYNIFTERYWDKAGYGSFDEFLMELRMSRQTASKLITIYRIYIVEKKVALTQLLSVRSWESLYLARSLATTPEKTQEVVESCAVMSQHDVRELVVDDKECEGHDFYEMRVCRNCGHKEMIYKD